MDNANEVLGGIFRLFNDHFSERTSIKKTLDKVSLPGILSKKAKVLSRRFVHLEMDANVAGMKDNKIPSPRGFNFNYRRSFVASSWKRCMLC